MISAHDIRGTVVGVRTRRGGLCEIAFRVVGQEMGRVPPQRIKTFEYGKVVLETLISKHRHTLPYQDLRAALDNGSLVITDMD
jgi:hypothetical protein